MTMENENPKKESFQQAIADVDKLINSDIRKLEILDHIQEHYDDGYPYLGTQVMERRVKAKKCQQTVTAEALKDQAPTITLDDIRNSKGMAHMFRGETNDRRLLDDSWL